MVEDVRFVNVSGLTKGKRKKAKGDRNQKTEVRSLKTDDRGQRAKLKTQGSKLSSSNELNLSSEIHDSEGHCPFHRDQSNQYNQ